MFSGKPKPPLRLARPTGFYPTIAQKQDGREEVKSVCNCIPNAGFVDLYFLRQPRKGERLCERLSALPGPGFWCLHSFLRRLLFRLNARTPPVSGTKKRCGKTWSRKCGTSCCCCLTTRYSTTCFSKWRATR